MPTPPLRIAARAIILDDHERVLLVRYDEAGGFWATPGGALDSGENHHTAVLRELREELGIDPARVALGAQLAERSKEHLVGDQDVMQVERYFLARIDLNAIAPDRATQPDAIRAFRWWTMEELGGSSEPIYPIGLGDLITSVLIDGVPDHPVYLG